MNSTLLCQVLGLKPNVIIIKDDVIHDNNVSSGNYKVAYIL